MDIKEQADRIRHVQSLECQIEALIDLYRKVYKLPIESVNLVKRFEDEWECLVNLKSTLN